MSTTPAITSGAVLRTRRSSDAGPPPGGTTVRPRPAIAALVGIRAIMGLWVVADHLREPMIRLLPALEVLRPLLRGGLALETFFILSGFIISYNYAERFATSDRCSYGAFLWARVARVYPTHLFALAVTAAVVAFVALQGRALSPSSDYSVWTFLGSVFLLQAVPGVTPWNWPSWSVSSEFAAYLVFPFVAATLARASRRTALVLAVVVVTAQVALLNMLMSTPLKIVALMWVRTAGEFTLGCLLWAAWRHGVRSHWRWDAVAVTSLGVAVLVVGSVPPAASRFVAVPLLGVFVVAVASATGIVRRVMTCRPVEWCGRTSYSRYLMHSPVLAMFFLRFPVGPFTSASLGVRIAVVASWFVATFAVGGISYHLVEEPARRWLKRRAKASSPDDAGPAASAQAAGTRALTAGEASAR